MERLFVAQADAPPALPKKPLRRAKEPYAGDRLLYTRDEAAARLSLSVSTIDMLISRNLLASRKIGHKRLIAHASLIAFAQKNLTRLWLPKVNGKTVNTERSRERELAKAACQ